MNRYEAGMLAVSRAGHDKGQLYVIIKVEQEYIYVADGKLKLLESPKKKNIKHIQVIHTIPEELEDMEHGNVKNEDIRRVIRRFTNV